MRPALVIWGASGHALVVADIVRLCGEYELVGFLDDRNPDRAGTELAGLPVLGGKECLPALRQRGVQHLILGFGDNRARLSRAAYARGHGFALATAIHPRAVVASGVSVGAGTVIAAGAVVNPATHIDENVIINTSASVDHDSAVAAGAHVSPGAHLAGGVTIGRAAWVGIGATVIEGVRIGANVMVGAGAVVLADLPDDVVAYGVPARIGRRL